MVFFVDGVPCYTGTPASSSIPSGEWEFNAPFFILLNVAIGGPSTFLGTPDPNAPFPNQDMLVDYVRVYQPVSTSAATPVVTPGQVVNAASFLGSIAPGGLATLFGNSLSDNTYQGSQVLDANNHFMTQVAGVSVHVDGLNGPACQRVRQLKRH